MKHIIDLCTPEDDLKVIIQLRKNKGFDLVWPPRASLEPSYKGVVSQTVIVEDWVKDSDAAGNKVVGSPVDKRLVLVFQEMPKT